jgi:ABC-type sugar transport system substrate-binding protein
MKRILVAVVLALFVGAPLARSADEKKPTIAHIIFQDDQFFRLIFFGGREAAEKNGVELREGNSVNKLEKERQLVDTYITSKVDAICISALSTKASAETLKRAKARGLVVIAENSPVDGEPYDALIQSDQHDLGVQTGESAAKYITEKLGGKAKIAILQYKSLLPEQSGARLSGFKDALKDMPGVEFVADQDAWLPEAAVKKAGDILTAHPDLNMIWAANEGGTLGATLAIKNSGRAGKVVVFGTDVGEQMLGFLRSPDDILQATTAQQPFKIGTTAIETALKVLHKEPVEKIVILKGQHLTRSKMDEIDAYEKQLKEWMAKSSG